MNPDVLAALEQANKAHREWMESPPGSSKSKAAMARLDAARTALHYEMMIALRAKS